MNRIPIIFLILYICTIGLFSCEQKVSSDKIEKISAFLKDVVSATLEEDYRSHDIYMHVQVSDLTIDRITKKETGQDNQYFVQGKVSYIVKGKRLWKDKEGNVVKLGPEQTISHWFSCGVLEDKYLGELFKDDRNRLIFYADNPLNK